MSTNYLKIFPTDMGFIPEQSDVQKSVIMLEKYIGHGEIDSDITDAVMLMDIGDNLETIICHECNSKNTINNFDDNDVIGTWWNSIDAAIEDVPAFGVKTTMPCCDKIVDFTSLTFQMPSGFARFSLCCCDPDDMLNDKQVKSLERILGCNLNLVWARY